MTNLDPHTPIYPIGVVAATVGISVETIRLYERSGLILTTKTDGNQRLFSKSDVKRIECIRNAINKEKISIAGINRMFSLIPCWDIVKCSGHHRRTCNAFLKHIHPCWSIDHKKNPCASLNCRECEVYHLSSDCHKIKQSIANLSRHV